MAEKPAGQSYSTDPALYLYTSLTAGSSHIVTATSRLETILRANRVPFKAIDIATDEKARMIWGRRAGKDEGGRLRKLPGLVQEGLVLGDLVEIEDWNEYGELKQHVKIYYDDFTIPSISQKPKTPPPRKPAVAAPPTATAASSSSAAPKPAPEAPPLPEQSNKENAKSGATGADNKKSGVAAAAASATMPIRSIAEEAAQKAKQVKLQSLRDKVHGKKDKDGDKKEETTEAATKGGDEADKVSRPEAEAKDSEQATTDPVTAAPLTREMSTATGSSVATTTSTGSSVAPLSLKAAAAAGLSGLQSPTTGAWKGGSAGASKEALQQVVQSPTTTMWKPTDVNAPVAEHMGAKIASASEEEIKAVEKAEAIEEESEEDDEDEDEDEDDDDDEESEDEAPKKAQA